MESRTFIPVVLIAAAAIGIATLVLVVRDRLSPPKPVETPADWAAQQRRVMKLWAFGAILFLIASWLVKRWR